METLIPRCGSPVLLSALNGLDHIDLLLHHRRDRPDVLGQGDDELRPTRSWIWVDGLAYL